MTKSSSRKDPKPYIDLKHSGADAKRVYIKAREDGYKNYECLFLICGIFDLELHEAREIAHSVNLPPKKNNRDSHTKKPDTHPKKIIKR